MSAYGEKPTAFDVYVGRCLRATRMALGLTLGDAGAMTGIPAMNLQSYETARRTCPLETLVRLAAFYGARITDFIP